MAVWDTHPEYRKQAPKWKRARDAVAGSDAVKGAGAAYLPMLKDQDEDDYKSYLMRATWFGASAMVVSGLKGMIFRMPTRRVLPDAILSYLDDIDLKGTPISVFEEEYVEEILTVGRVGTLVDHPVWIDTSGVAVTKAIAEAANLRPTLQLYRTERILNWDHRRIANKWELCMVVLEEYHTEKVSEFKSTVETRWRVLDLDINNEYRQRMFRKRTEKEAAEGKPEEIQVGSDVYPMMDNKRLNYIPFYAADEDDVDICPGEPPLIDLIDLNLAHFRVSADYEHGCHFTGLPTPVISGYSPEQNEDGTAPAKLYVGSSHAWVFPDPQATATYLEFHGTGLAALEKNLDRKEAQMATIGARMLTPENNGKTPTGATTTVVNRTGESSRLASISQAASLSFTRALKTFCEWSQAPSKEVVIKLNKDFLPIIVDSNALNALVAAVAAKALPFEDFWNMLQRGDIAPQDKDAEQAIAQIKANPDFIGQPPTKTADAPAPATKAAGGGSVK